MEEVNFSGSESLIIEPLETIEALRDKVYPSEALETAAAPFAFYRLLQEGEEEDLEGPNELKTSIWELSLVAKRLAAVGLLSDQARQALKAAQGTTVGGRYIERISVKAVTPEDYYEKLVGLFRRMFRVTVYWQ